MAVALLTFMLTGLLLRAKTIFAADSLDALRRRIDARVGGVASLTTAELSSLLAAGAAHPLVLDVRARVEYDVSHLPGALWAETQADQLRAIERAGPGRTVVLYCSVGWRSGVAVERLRALGKTQVFNLRGSIFQWANEGRSLVDERGAVTRVHPFDPSWGRLLDRQHWSQ